MKIITGESIETIKTNGFDYPVVTIKSINGTTGYLVPFRFYSFQVCGSKSGEMDLGSSSPKRDMMKNIVSYNSKDSACKLLKKEVCKCINSFMNTTYGYIKGRRIAYTVDNEPQYTQSIIEYEIPHFGDFNEFFDIDEIEFIDQFIEETYNMVVDYYNIKVA